MNAATLPRIVVPTFDFTEVMSLATRSRERLGYTGYIHRIAANNFLHMLAKHGVAPFDIQAVEDYKKKKLRAAAGPFFISHFNGWAWRTARLSSYTGLIPREVMEKALAIRNDEPRATFLVDYLAEERREVRDPDPFLVVQREEGAPWHYIAVWDEPKFIV